MPQIKGPCKRGHKPQYKNQYGTCKICHADLMYRKRHGLATAWESEARYVFKIGGVPKNRVKRMLPEFLGISLHTFNSWAYPRTGQPRRSVSRDRAVWVADTLRIDFDRIWEKKEPP